MQTENESCSWSVEPGVQRVSVANLLFRNYLPLSLKKVERFSAIITMSNLQKWHPQSFRSDQHVVVKSAIFPNHLLTGKSSYIPKFIKLYFYLSSRLHSSSIIRQKCFSFFNNNMICVISFCYHLSTQMLYNYYHTLIVP